MDLNFFFVAEKPKFLKFESTMGALAAGMEAVRTCQARPSALENNIKG
jgi:hypothetical protein